MDPDTIKTLIALSQGGGPVVTAFALWIAFKAGHSARDAVKALEELRDAVTTTKPIVERMAVNLEDIEHRSDELVALANANGMKLDAVLANQKYLRA
jgi:hypothetical protein